MVYRGIIADTKQAWEINMLSGWQKHVLLNIEIDSYTGGALKDL